MRCRARDAGWGLRRCASARTKSARNSPSAHVPVVAPLSPSASRRSDRMTTAIRLLIVDDHAVVRQGLRGFLRLQDGIEVVGEAASAAEAIDIAGTVSPD